MNTTQQKIESLLFYRNEPLSFSWLAKKININEDELREELFAMLPFYENRGLQLVITEDTASLLVSPDSENFVEELFKSEEGRDLSKQAMETLAIILYAGKITKQEIDYIRGVNSLYILRNLLIRGLIEKKVNTKDKRSPFYSITQDTLSFLGISHREDLENYQQFAQKIEKTFQQYTEEISEDRELPTKDNNHHSS